MTEVLRTRARVPETEYSYRDRLLVVTRGGPLPAGAMPTPNGINFVLISRHATAVWLVLSEPCDNVIYAEIPLNPRFNRTGDHWHVRIDGLPEVFCYGYRVDGPKGMGHRFDPTRILHDPFARARFLAAAPGALPASCLRRSLMVELMIDRQRPIHPRHAARGHDHLRAPRQRLHRLTQLGGPSPRDLCRPRREDRLHQVAGCDGSRASAGG